MSYPNGQTVSDVKKNVSNLASKAVSEAKDIKSDLKSEAKSVASKVERKIDAAADSKSPSSIANTVLTSALSLLPVRDTDEVVSMLETTVKDIQSSAITARDSAASFVKKYPLYSLLGAAAIGAGAVLLFSSMSKSRLSTDA